MGVVMTRPQKGKHLKRRRSWHRGRGQAHQWLSAVRRLERAERRSEAPMSPDGIQAMREPSFVAGRGDV
jgi:hypothetical protein